MANPPNKDDFNSAPTIMEVGIIQAPGAAPLPAQAVDGQPVAARPVVDLLKDAFELYKKHLQTFLLVVAVAMAPVYLVKDLIVATTMAVPAAGLQIDTARIEATNRELQEAMQRGASPEEIQRLTAASMEAAAAGLQHTAGAMAGVFAMLLGLLLTIPFMMLAQWLSQGALIVSAADAARDGGLGWQGAWRVLLRRLGPLLVTALLGALITAVGVVLCVVPGLVFGFLASFAVPVALLENKSGMDAIKRSIELVKKDWLRVLIVLVVFAVLTGVARWVGGLFIPSRFLFVHELVGDLVSIVVAPFGIIGTVLLFNDVRRVHFDLTDDALRQAEDALLAGGEPG
jgi:hypothetical protein